MKSLQGKLIKLITSALLTLAVFVGGFSLITTNLVVMRDSELMMDAVCMKQALLLDNQLERVEQAVTTIYLYASGELTSLEVILDRDSREAYTERVRTLALDISNNTDGAMAVYLRFNPALSDSISGFFWSKPDTNSVFMYNPPTDLSLYDRDDVEHVGWYYQPIDFGKPMWMSPYYNQNCGIEMISYVIPFFYEDTLIGVIGMDIDFSLFVDIAQEAVVYRGGKANLIDMSSKDVFYRNPADHATTVQKTKLTDDLYTILDGHDNNGEALSGFKADDISYKMSFQTVRNGMKYVLYSPTGEINLERNLLFLGLVLLTVFILIVFLIFTIYMTKKIIKPLGALNDAARQMAGGDLNVTIECSTNDEIGTLTNSINVMAVRLREYVAKINAIAYTDSLTGVKNKIRYMDHAAALSQDEYANYAVVVFDVNDLKKVNDAFGHEQGDALLGLASGYIRAVFSGSDIYRIGGDEFAAILTGADYENRAELLSVFEEEMFDQKMPIAPYSTLSVAFGAAVREKGMSFDDVFRMADQRMYKKKKAMKDEQTEEITL